MFTVTSAVVLYLVVVIDKCRGYVEMAPVLEMLNLPWEGECPVTPRLRVHPQLKSLGWIGRCPTVYRVVELPESSEPRAILAGYCDPSCHNSECSPLGNFRCRNHTVGVDIATLRVTDQGEVIKLVRTEDIPIGCVCRSKKYTRLGNHIPETVE